VKLGGRVLAQQAEALVLIPSTAKTTKSLLKLYRFPYTMLVSKLMGLA
jgi:hypothetical protein